MARGQDSKIAREREPERARARVIKIMIAKHTAMYRYITITRERVISRDKQTGRAR